MGFLRAGLLVFLSSTLFYCSTTPQKQPPVKALPSAVTEFKRINDDVSHVKAELSVKRLIKFIANHPNSELNDSAWILMGNLYFQKQNFQNAYQSYFHVVSSEVASPRENEALYLSAKSLFYLGRYDEALELANRGLAKNDLTDGLQTNFKELHFVVNNQLGNRLEALRDVVFLTAHLSESQNKERYRLKGIEIVENKLNEDELEKVADTTDYGYLQAYSAFRLGSFALEKRDPSRARDYLNQALKRSADSQLTARATSLIEQLDARKRVNSNTIGVVLPLSGRYQTIGNRSLHGIQLALGTFNASHPSNFRLAIGDSEGNPDIARRAVESLVTQDGVIAIVGGLLSKTATAEASKAQELGVPLIALSQGSGVTDVGDSIFRNALTSQMQVHELLDIAMGKLGYHRFAVLFPNDAYGNEFSALFWDEVLARGGQITGAQTYDPKETDFKAEVQKLVGTYYQDDRSNEYRLRLKEWKDKQSRKTDKKPPADLLPPIVDFDALFVPDSARAMGQIAPMLAYNDVDNVRLLGTNLWNTDEFVKRGQKFVENAVFVDSMLEDDPLMRKSRFYDEFKKTFQGEDPGLFEVQAYDSALILRQLIIDGNTTRLSVVEHLSKLRNFPGALGSLSMNDHREILRPVLPLTVQKGTIVQLP